MLNRLTDTSRIEMGKAEEQFDIREWLNFIWRQWKFVSVFTAIGMLVGAVVLVRSIPIYTASSQVLLDPRKSKTMGDDALYSDEALTVPAIESQVAIIRSTSLLRRVVERERLVAPEQDRSALKATENEVNAGSSSAGPTPTLFSKVTSIFPGLGRDVPQESGAVISQKVQDAIEVLRGSTTVSRAGNSYILTISFVGTDPVRAARMANAIADAYIIDKLDARFEAAKRSSVWLSDRISELRKQVRESEEAVVTFRAEHNLLQGTANVTLNQQQLNDLNGRLVAARAEVGEKKARLDLLISTQNKGGSVNTLLPDLINAPVLGALRTQAAGISQREADLLARYGDRHPLVVNIQAEKRDVEQHIAEEIKKLAANVKNEYDIAKARADSLEQSLRQVTGQSDLDNKDIVTLREMERTAQVNKSLFEDFLQRSKLTQEQATFEVRDARIITPALPPNIPTSPNKTRVMSMAVMIGLFLGITAALAKEMLNSGFITPKQIEDMLGLPLLTSVSTVGANDLTVEGKIVGIPQYVVLKPLSRYSECFRALRSGIQMTDVDNPPKVVQVTSSVPSEGKTTIALSLAASAASSGGKVLIIDCDLRRPSGTKLLGMDREMGLVDVLLGTVPIQEAMRFNEQTRFWMLGAGSKTQNPADLLSSDRMKALVSTFRASFDFIVIDTPPAGPVIDPVIVSHIVDKVIYVVRWASTARELVERVINQFSSSKNIAGVVFNRVDDREAQKYGKYAYSYYYGARHYKNYYQS